MTLDTVAILDGSTFVVSDRRGDLDASPADNHGLFLEDTRFLSHWILTVGGIRPKMLSVDDQAYYRVQFFEAVTTGTVYVDSHLSVLRKRSRQQRLPRRRSRSRTTTRSRSRRRVKLETRSDFADLFEVKDKLAKVGELYRNVKDGALTLGYRRDTFVRETVIKADKKGEIHEDGFIFQVKSLPKLPGHVTFDVAARPARDRDIEDESPRVSQRDSDAAARPGPARNGSPPRRGWWPAGSRCTGIYRRSLVDLAALRFYTGVSPARCRRPACPGSWRSSAGTV